MKDYRRISDVDGEELVKTARLVITEYLTNSKKIKLNQEFEKKFSFDSGVFVTLNKNNGLRGCIGFPLPYKKLSSALMDAAISAATEDSRFPSVKKEELIEITIEVTILTTPTKILVADPMEYVSKIKVGRDGLIVKQGYNSGLLLPQVPLEYGWNEEEFLNHTCEKAGLPKEEWKKNKVEILKFEGIVFEEQTSNGKIIRKKL